MINANNPLTLNPGTREAESQKQKPLIINVNPPKLNIVNGKEKRASTGRIIELTPPKTMAPPTAAEKLFNVTPGKIISTTKRLKAVASRVKTVDSMYLSDMCITTQYLKNIKGTLYRASAKRLMIFER